MLKIKRNESINLQIGDYLDLSKDGVISYTENPMYRGNNNAWLNQPDRLILGKTPIDERFANRKNLKAVVIDISDEEITLEPLFYADLHRHSGYSLLDGSNKIADLVEKTEYVGALTDHGNLFGMLDYYKSMKAANKQAIIGMEAYCETIDGEKKSNHLILLAKTYKGYQNLAKLSSLSYQKDHFYRKPHVNYNDLRKYSEDIICLSACIGGEIPQAILHEENLGKATEIASALKEIFQDDFYLEIQRHNLEEEKIVNPAIMTIASLLDIKVVATSDSHYTLKEDYKAHEILLAIGTKSTLDDPNRYSFKGEDYHLMDSFEFSKKYADIPEVLDNTLEIAEKCKDFEIELGKIKMPNFKIPGDDQSKDAKIKYLKKLVFEGYKNRGLDINNQVYINRIKKELEVIISMDFVEYFLIVGDYINWAKNHGVAVGLARGSAAGSLVTYCLNITGLDPIKHNLLFERFLNKERVSMPDIDTDFDYEKREEVIDYVKSLYGEDHVSNIITFGTLGAKMVVRDVARVLGYDYELGDKISKEIPEDPKMTIDKALEVNPELQLMYNSDEEVKEIIDYSKRLEGLPRHASKHACGVIIADKAVSEYIPEAVIKDKLVTQVNMIECEDLGLLKMDFLGLRTMTVLRSSIESINKNEGLNLSYETIPFDDPYVYSYLSKGHTEAVFQLEGTGMTETIKALLYDVDDKIKVIEDIEDDKARNKALKELGEECFSRVVAGVSLYRPGPMQFIPQYIEGLKDPSSIVYDHPSLEPVLKETMGLMVYQEQIMQVAQVLAGYTLGEADILRRAIGKKKLKILEEQKDNFIKGAINNNVAKEVAEKVFEKIVYFADYGFNKSHAAAYACLGMQTAWLKYYYPVDFMAMNLNSFFNDPDKLTYYLGQCLLNNIKILPPDVNKSSLRFERYDDKIIFGLQAIKNLGKASELIIKEREEYGEFKGFQEFFDRMSIRRKITTKNVESLNFAGAFDNFSKNRQARASIIKDLSKSVKSRKTRKTLNSPWLEDLPDNEFEKYNIETPDVNEFNVKFKLKMEKEIAGFYVSGHPLDLSIYDTSLCDKLESLNLVNSLVTTDEGNKVWIKGIITDVKTFYTKKSNEPLMIFKIEDQYGQLSAVCFNKQLGVNISYIYEGSIVLVEGTYQDGDYGRQVIVDLIYDLEQYISQNKNRNKVVSLKITCNSDKKTMLAIVDKYKDSNSLTDFYLLVGNRTFKVPMRVDIDSYGLRQELFDNFGEKYNLQAI